MLEKLQRLRQQRFLSDLDVHFAKLIGRLADKDSPELMLAACLASRGASNGNVCISIAALAGRPVLDLEDSSEALLAPAASAWIAALRASAIVGEPGEFQPLVLDHKGRLYLYRYWHYEQQLAQDLLRRAATDPDDVNTKELKIALNRLFPDTTTQTNWQKIAAAVAVLKRVCIISGGPGTGKTSIVVRILALLAAHANQRPLRIGLAAPTGKAAARLQEAIRSAKRLLDLDDKALIPEDAATLHRLLGAHPDSVYFRYNRYNPLPLDVLIVDEASMVDLALMAKLVSALPAQARLILLGDRDQLASVEAGAVLADICGAAPGFSEGWRNHLQELTGEMIPASGARVPLLASSIVLLEQSYRFSSASGIASLVLAVNQGHGERALTLLESSDFSDLAWRSPDSPRCFREHLSESIERGCRPYLEQVKANAPPEQIFAAFNRFRILCALREGPAGVEELNRLSEAILHSRRLIAARQRWYPGRPIMITRNDYNLRLFNGDVGIALIDPDAGGRLRVFFENADGGLRRFPPSRLPEHETVYAMTVHKSQGSEFDHVLLILPFEPCNVLTRELIYTGISRARKVVEIWGNPDVFKAAVARRLRRFSGLREMLWGE